MKEFKEPEIEILEIAYEDVMSDSIPNFDHELPRD